MPRPARIERLARLSVFALCLGLAPTPVRPAAAAPTGVSAGPTASAGDKAALGAAFEKVLTNKALKGARVTVYVAPANGGPVVYEHAGDERLHPASNTKLLTTAAVLVRLGPEYTWHTPLTAPTFTDGVASSLTLVARGDPSFVTETLAKLVEDAHLNGLREVAGDLVVDESYFGPEHSPPGFDAHVTDEAFRAPSGAASLNFNQIAVQIAPGAKAGDPVVVRLSPDCNYARVDNKATTRAKGRPRAEISVLPDHGKVVVRISGTLPVGAEPYTTRRRIDDPALFTGMALRKALEQSGIPVRGTVRIQSTPTPAGGVEIARTVSRPLGTLIGDVNKYSNNFMAEQLLRTLGAVKRGRGDWDAGRAEVLDFAQVELGLTGIRYANGSGLFGDTALSGRDFVTLLSHMHTRRPYLPEFEASLAIGGADGTMQKRAHGFAPYTLRVKTGTLDGVVALSGYAPFADGSVAAFSILMNDVAGRPWEIWKLHDRMLTLIGAWDPTTSTLRPVAGEE